jgi:hypothetical protein
MTIGATFNILSSGVNSTDKPKNQAVVINMVLEFGEFLPSYKKQNEAPKELQHQEPVPFTTMTNEFVKEDKKLYAFCGGWGISPKSLQECIDFVQKRLSVYPNEDYCIFDGNTLTWYSNHGFSDVNLKDLTNYIKRETIDLESINFIVGLPTV